VLLDQSSASRSYGRVLALILPLRERGGPERRSSAERREDHDAGRGVADEDGRDAVGLFDRLRGRGAGGGGRRGTLDRGSQRGDLSHLEQFVATRRGVEGYVEPRTAVTETTIVLVAADGEWTRRRIDGPDVARKLSRDLSIPVYDAQVTGYPQRMRTWSAEQKDNRLE
jgi:hypothetical protein